MNAPVRMTARLGVLALSLTMLSCSRNPSILLDTAGPHAEKISHLFWYFLSVNALVWVLVLGFLLYSLWKRREKKQIDPIQPSAQTERRSFIAVAFAVGATALILTSFVVMSFLVDQDLIDLDRDPTIEIEVTAHQWWWELRYKGKTPSETFITANEIHVPVNEKVRLKLRSSDVIHSLWFPNLSGKQDIIPGHEREMVIRADREGVWRGRCGEFCGLQHAKMGLALFAEPREAFEAWKMAQLKPAAEPVTAQQKRGREVFTTTACTLCHSIRGTSAAGVSNHAPDLTHLKSRTTIGAGAALNTKGHLGGWIIDPHGIKPGVHMPTILQEPGDFQALLAYLETLK